MKRIGKDWVETHIDSNGECIIPDGVEKIEEEAFRDNKNIKKITIPSSVTEIGIKAFYGCSSLEQISIPSSVEQIKEGAFAYCSVLQEVEINKNSKLEGIGQHAFDSCKKLHSVSIPNGVKNIGAYAFTSCEKLHSISIPDNVKTINVGTFSNCHSLALLDLGNGIENIEETAFCGCEKLESVYFPDSLSKIGIGAFFECNNLTELTGAEKVEQIEGVAFGNTNINTFKMQTASEFPAGLLLNCANLNKLYLDKNMEYVSDTGIDGVDNLNEVEINGTKRIGYKFFQDKSSINKIFIDGNEYSLDENEKLFSLQKAGDRVAIVCQNEQGKFHTKEINLDTGEIDIMPENMYLTNEGELVHSINDTSQISLNGLQDLKKSGMKQIYIYGHQEGLSQLKQKKLGKQGVEFGLYDIDELIQVKAKIEEIKQEILLPNKHPHSDKMIYTQLVRKLSEEMEHDFYGEYRDTRQETKKEKLKKEYENATKGKWEEYFNQNKGRNIEQTDIEDGSLIGLINGRALCRGNAEIIRNLCAEFNIESIVINGSTHAWNQVKLDGVWYDDDFTSYNYALKRKDTNAAKNVFLRSVLENGKSRLPKYQMSQIRSTRRPNAVGTEVPSELKKELLAYDFETVKLKKQQSINAKEKERPAEESIRDEVGDESKQKTEEQKQKEQETRIMEVLKKTDKNAAKLPNSAKRKEDFIQDMQKEKEQQDKRKEQEEQEEAIMR